MNSFGQWRIPVVFRPIAYPDNPTYTPVRCTRQIIYFQDFKRKPKCVVFIYFLSQKK